MCGVCIAWFVVFGYWYCEISVGSEIHMCFIICVCVVYRVVVVVDAAFIA